MTESKIDTNNKEPLSLKEVIVKINDWWKFMLSKALIITLFGLLGGVLGLAYAYLKRPLYVATTTFVLEDEKGSVGLGNLAGLASMVGFDFGGSGGGIFQGDNILGLYKSRTMLEQTLLTTINVNGKKQLLVDRFIEFNKLREKWSDKPALANLQFPTDSLQNGVQLLKPNRLRDSIIREIVTELNKNYLTVAKPDKKLSTIQVDVRAKDEIFAKAFNDELVKKVNEFYINTKTKKALQNVQILQHKTDSVKAVMNGAIYTSVAVTDATPNLNPTRQVQRIVPAQRAQFSAETNKAILGELVKNLELSKMGLLKETPLIQLIDRPIMPLDTIKPSKIKSLLFTMFFAVFLTVLFLSVKELLRKIMSA